MVENNIYSQSRKLEFDVRSLSVSGKFKSRKVNEDFMYVDKERHIYIVADGLGGHGGGREASRLTVQSVADKLTELYERLQTKEYDPDKIERKITHIVEETNLQIIRPIADFSKNLQDIGTTLVTLFYHNGWAYIHNVGDSHAFLYGIAPDRKKYLIPLTEDDRIKEGYEHLINIKGSEEEVQKAKDELKIRLLKARLEQYIGKEDIKVHAYQAHVNYGDIFLVTTDGILTSVHENEIAKILNDEEFDAVPEKLVEKANNPEYMAELYSKYMKVDKIKAFEKLAGSDDMTLILLRAREAGQSAC